MRKHIDNLAVGLRSWVNGLAILIAAAVCSGAVSAQTPRLRLGAPQVLSSLGSPLWVRIPIDAAESSEALTSTRFSVGAIPSNAALPFIERAEITVEKQGDQYALVIRSRNVIIEPVVGIVIRDELPSGTRSREIFLLLDPPSRSPAASNKQRLAAGETAPAVQQPEQASVRPAIAAARPTMPLDQAAKRPVPPKVRAEAVATVTGIARGDSVSLPRIKPQNLAVTVPAYTAGSPSLRLSFGEDFVARRPATDEERAELRMRRFTLNVDDMTADLFERQYRTMQLEKGLTSLSARISAAERVIDSALPGAAVSAAATVAPPGAAPEVVAPVVLPAPAPAPTAAPPAATSTVAPVQDQAESRWRRWVADAGLLALLIAAIWGVLYLLLTRRQASRLDASTANAYIEEVLPREVKREAPTVVPAATANKPTPQASPTATAKPGIENKDVPLPEIQFELPELSSETQEAIQQQASGEVAAFSPTLNAVDISIDDAAARRLLGLLTKYEDIARLKPRVDSPRRLLEQAAILCDHGETDFAIRLLSFSAYSQPATPEYWLALLELLYLEKQSREYLVNAAMFYQFHAKSIHWDEVVRIGYLLNPLEPLFAPAKTWSHDAPAIGTWLPFYPLKKSAETPVTRR